MAQIPFWQRKPLSEMTTEEWESLCDGCGRCCLQKLQDEDTDDVFYTDLACRYLDSDACRCTVYGERFERVPDCLDVSALEAEEYAWLPRSCAYRRLAEGRPLADWHPLLSGDPETVHRAGISVRDKVVPETAVPESLWEERLIRWID